MLYKYLTDKYKPNEPIFLSDINLPISDVNLRQMFKVLCDSRKINRFDTGVYYIPKESRLRDSTFLTADTVAKYKYVEKNGKIDGYYSGYTFANQMGLSTQVPYVTEIVSNNASAAVREVTLKGQRLMLRKARIPVDNKNYKTLQFLDLLKDIDVYMDCGQKEAIDLIKKYIINEKITNCDVNGFLNLYPDKIFRNYYKLGLYDVFTQ